MLSSLRVLGNDVSSHPDAKLLTMVMEGVKQKPSRSLDEDDDVRWKLSDLTDYWAVRPTSSLDVPSLRAKCLCLLMIAGIARPSDLARLDLSIL